jgi:hypothetical protein
MASDGFTGGLRNLILIIWADYPVRFSAGPSIASQELPANEPTKSRSLPVQVRICSPVDRAAALGNYLRAPLDLLRVHLGTTDPGLD